MKAILKNDSYKISFVLISILLSLISLQAGFAFYEAIYGMTVAILASFTFETLRLATLFAWLRGHGRWLSFSLYVAVAGVCAFAAVASFHSSIIENYEKAIAAELERQHVEVDKIKSAYADERRTRLNDISKQIEICERRVAQYPESSYWPRRLEQANTSHERVSILYDSLLAYKPSDIEEWIAKESAKYGIMRESGAEHGKAWATTKAIRDLWGLSEIEAKKTAAIIIVLGIELGILMLSLLARPSRSAPLNGKYAPLIREFGREDVLEFLEDARKYYDINATLPPARILSRKQRLIRRTIIDKKIDIFG